MFGGLFDDPFMKALLAGGAIAATGGLAAPAVAGGAAGAGAAGLGAAGTAGATGGLLGAAMPATQVGAGGLLGAVPIMGPEAGIGAGLGASNSAPFVFNAAKDSQLANMGGGMFGGLPQTLTEFGKQAKPFINAAQTAQQVGGMFGSNQPDMPITPSPTMQPTGSGSQTLNALAGQGQEQIMMQMQNAEKQRMMRRNALRGVG